MTSSASSSIIASIPPIVNEKKKLIPRGRVKDAASVRTIWQHLFNEDKAASLQRALYQEMLDGKPPMNPAKLKARGLSGTTNINWNLAQQAQEEAEMPYNDIRESLDIFCSMPTKYGEPADRAINEPIMAEEFARVLRKWEPFEAQWQYNVHLFTAEGVSFALFEDERGWEYDYKGLQHLKIPRASRADVNKLDVVACKVATKPNKIYQITQNPGSEQAGWNVANCKKALVECTKIEGQPTEDFQAWEAQWKNNDVTASCKAMELQLIHLWVQELDGTVTRLIATESGECEILYKSEGKIKSMSQTLIAYLFNVGTNGDFHSVRGLASKVFPMAGGINRAFNKMIDLAVHISTPHLKSASEDGNIDAMIRPMGMYAVLQSGAEPVEIQVPSMQTTLIPIINTLQSFMGARTSQYTQGLPNQLDKTERTATEKKMQYAAQGKLSSSGMNLFFAAWGKHLKEVVRRMIRRDYQQDEPGGALVWEWRNRCLARGVQLEYLYAIDIDAIEVNTGIGKGSAAERMVAIDGVGQTYPDMDSFAKNEFNRERVAAYWGTQKAELMFPKQPGMRPPMEAGMAALENPLMAMTGEKLAVKPNQDHFTHIIEHLPYLQERNQAIIDGLVSMEEAIPKMTPVWEHSNDHLELLPITNPHRSEIKQALAELGQVIINQNKKLAAVAQREQEAAAEQGGEEAGPGNDRTANDLIQSVQAGMKLDALAKEMELKDVDRQKQLMHKDALAAQQIGIIAAKESAKKVASSKK